MVHHTISSTFHTNGMVEDHNSRLRHTVIQVTIPKDHSELLSRTSRESQWFDHYLYAQNKRINL